MDNWEKNVLIAKKKGLVFDPKRGSNQRKRGGGCINGKVEHPGRGE